MAVSGSYRRGNREFWPVCRRNRHRNLSAPGTSGRLKDIRVPTLVLVGEDERRAESDMSHRESAEVLANGIPDSRLVILPGEGHNYFFSAPEATNKRIREFL